MRGGIPPRPAGFNPEAIYAQSIWDENYGPQARLNNTGTVKVTKTSSGIFFKVSATPTGGVQVKMYRFKSLAGDYLICRTWDGTTEGTVDVYIAKPPKLRTSILTETLRGVVINYTAYDNSANGQTRVATQAGAGGATETQYITPPYLVNDLIYGVVAKTLVQTTPVGTPPAVQTVKVLDLNIDAREWAEF